MANIHFRKLAEGQFVAYAKASYSWERIRFGVGATAAEAIGKVMLQSGDVEDDEAQEAEEEAAEKKRSEERDRKAAEKADHAKPIEIDATGHAIFASKPAHEEPEPVHDNRLSIEALATE